MPWLAPIGTPGGSAPIDSQVPIWQSSRASRSRGSAFTRGSACGQQRQPLQRLGVAIGMRLARAQRPRRNGRRRGCRSTETAIPACARVIAGIEDHRARHHQRMRQLLLDLGGLVGDAGHGAEFAAGDRGRHADLAHGRAGSSAASRRLTARTRSISSALRMSLARQICTALAPSVIEPPPTVTMRSASAARACSVAAITAARGVCAGIASKMPAQRGAERVADLSDLVGLRGSACR